LGITFGNMQPQFFKDKEALRKWFSKNYKTEPELWLGYYKTNTGKPSITWSESVDVALCFGWIDGVRKSLGDESYVIRFTKRKPTSIWSTINIRKVEELTKQGLMLPEGLEAFSKRNPEKSGIYSFENDAKEFSKEYEKKFKANKAAWKFFTAQAPYYKKQMIHRVVSAKQKKTQVSRLEKLIAASEEGKRIL
jgi:uncharacterized protein YdeI (YjbR/CyaY-like superfamily)